MITINHTELSNLAENKLSRISDMDKFDANCPAHQMLEQIANKWTLLILFSLSQGKKRYNELKLQIDGVSPKMLIQNLRNLERHGLVKRRIYPTVPPIVEYSLTELGISLFGPLAALGEWAYHYLQNIQIAISEFDNKSDDDSFWSPK